MLLCFPCISVTPRSSHCLADAPLLSLYQYHSYSVIAWRMFLCFPCISVTPRASHSLADVPLLYLYQCYTYSITFHSGCSFAFPLSVLHLERYIIWRMFLCFPCISVTPRASHCIADAPLLSLYQCYTLSVTLPGVCSFSFAISVLHLERHIA